MASFVSQNFYGRQPHDRFALGAEIITLKRIAIAYRSQLVIVVHTQRWTPGGGTGGTECTSQHVGKN
jgi:hypothetical protein